MEIDWLTTVDVLDRWSTPQRRYRTQTNSRIFALSVPNWCRAPRRRTPWTLISPGLDPTHLRVCVCMCVCVSVRVCFSVCVCLFVCKPTQSVFCWSISHRVWCCHIFVLIVLDTKYQSCLESTQYDNMSSDDVADCLRLAPVLISGVLAVRRIPLPPRQPPHRPGGVVLEWNPNRGLVTAWGVHCLCSPQQAVGCRWHQRRQSDRAHCTPRLDPGKVLLGRWKLCNERPSHKHLKKN